MQNHRKCELKHRKPREVIAIPNPGNRRPSAESADKMGSETFWDTLYLAQFFHVVMITEEAVSPHASHFFDYAKFIQAVQYSADGCIGKSRDFAELGNIGYWMAQHCLMNQGSRFAGAPQGGDFYPVLGDLLIQGQNDFSASSCRFRHSV